MVDIDCTVKERSFLSPMIIVIYRGFCCIYCSSCWRKEIQFNHIKAEIFVIEFYVNEVVDIAKFKPIRKDLATVNVLGRYQRTNIP